MRDDVIAQDCGVFYLCTCVLLMWLLYRTLLIEVGKEGEIKAFFPPSLFLSVGKRRKALISSPSSTWSS